MHIPVREENIKWKKKKRTGYIKHWDKIHSKTKYSDKITKMQTRDAHFFWNSGTGTGTGTGNTNTLPTVRLCQPSWLKVEWVRVLAHTKQEGAINAYFTLWGQCVIWLSSYPYISFLA